jgi:DNA-binding transcriptional MocR family regulator
LSLTNSEINERLVHSVLTEGHHRRHVETLSAALLNAQSRVNAKLSEAGLTPFTSARGGMFTWARLNDCDISSREIADRARQKGIWLAPGEFFHLSPPQQPWFRFNVAYTEADELYDFFRTLNK